MPASTRGPLPAGVYWRRRLAVLSVALVVFLGVGRLLGAGGDGSSEDRAEQAGATTLTSPTATVPAAESTEDGTAGQGGQDDGGRGEGKGNGGKGTKGGKGGKGGDGGGATPSPTPTPTLPDPTGPCADNDVFITPTVPSPIGGQDVTVLLNLQTRVSQACTWQVSPETVVLDIVSGPDQIWLSSHCPEAIPVQDVVVRLASVTQVAVVWNARRSDEECSDRTAWALPGFYHVRSAAYGGEKTDVQFELVPPAPATVTQTVQPEPSGSGTARGGTAAGSGQRSR